jgi:hypothetical protein
MSRHRSALLVSELMASSRTSDEKPLLEKTSTAGRQCPATEIMVRLVRTALVHSSRLRCNKKFQPWETFFFLTPFIELIGH